MSTTTIKLGNEQFEVKPLPLGRLKKVLPAVSAVSIALVSAGSMRGLDEATFDQAAFALSVALDKPLEEIEAMPMQVDQLVDAIMEIASVCGLVGRQEPIPGEALPGQSPATTSTPSTDSLPTS